MKYCIKCGHQLVKRSLKHEGMIPYCVHCEEYRFPYANTAVSIILLSPDQSQVLLIQQYQKKDYILVAGYVNQQESLEEALYRECSEETGRKLLGIQYLKSAYYEASNTLMCCFIGVADSVSLKNISTWEIDKANWFSFTEALQVIKPNSLAKHFLEAYLAYRKNNPLILING
ncbi:NUDIX domain-containing protein [bacterium c-19]|nr:NUDIX domain-containing protein [bacterium c-19]